MKNAVKPPLASTTQDACQTLGRDGAGLIVEDGDRHRGGSAARRSTTTRARRQAIIPPVGLPCLSPFLRVCVCCTIFYPPSPCSLLAARPDRLALCSPGPVRLATGYRGHRTSTTHIFSSRRPLSLSLLVISSPWFSFSLLLFPVSLIIDAAED